MIVDAHQHFWRMDRNVYDWITDDISAIGRDYLPDHLAPYLNHLGIDQTILVQASETLEENDFLESLAIEADFIGGYVAWLDLNKPESAATLEKLSENQRIKGIRPVLQAIEDNDWILQKNVIANLKLANQLGFRFDALITERHLDAMAMLVDQIPDLPMVVDHAAKPVIASGKAPSRHWITGMKRLAEHPNVMCKYSGLTTEHGPGWTLENLKPVFDHLLDCFSADRLMWGSDWPVLELQGSYSQWFTHVKSVIANLDQTDQDKLLGLNAVRFYGL